MKRTSLILLFQFLLFGCNKPDPNPQLNDYIYQSLKSDLAAAEQSLNELKSGLSDLQAKLPSLDIQTAEVKLLRAKIDRAQAEVKKQEQRITYLKLRVLSREEYVREKSLEAFNKDQVWDNSEELSRYKSSQKRAPAQQ